jgi:hypothetical protein
LLESGRQRRRMVSEKINEAEAELIREAAERVLHGESLLGIANDWNARVSRPRSASRGTRRGCE